MFKLLPWVWGSGPVNYNLNLPEQTKSKFKGTETYLSYLELYLITQYNNIFSIFMPERIL